MNINEIIYKYSQKILRVYKNGTDVLFLKHRTNNKEIIICCHNLEELEITKENFNNHNSSKFINNEYIFKDNKYKILIIKEESDLKKIEGSLSDFLISFKIPLKLKNKIILNMDLKEKEIIEHIEFNNFLFK